MHVAMLDALGEWMSRPAYFSRYGREPPRRTGARHPSISPYGPFRVSDGSVFLGIQNEREWLVLCRHILRRGRPAPGPPPPAPPAPRPPPTRAAARLREPLSSPDAPRSS